MNWAMRLSYHIDRPQGSMRSYELEIYETDDPPQPWSQYGPVRDNRVTYWGVYATPEEAAADAADDIKVGSYVIFNEAHPGDGGIRRYNLGSPFLKDGARTNSGGVIDIIYRKTPLPRGGQ